MKIYLNVIALVFLCLIITNAQKINTIQKTESDSACLGFPMPIVNSLIDENKSPIVKPDTGIDFKLIIVNPCLSKISQVSIPLVPVTPNSSKRDGSQQSMAFEFNGKNFVYTLKNSKGEVLLPISK